MSVRARQPERKAMATVELAVLLPVLVLLLLASVDFGRYGRTRSIVINAARVGASYGSNTPFTEGTEERWRQQIIDAVNEEVDDITDFDSAKLAVTISTETIDDDTWEVSVVVSYPHETVVDWPGLPSTVTLAHKATVRSLRP